MMENPLAPLALAFALSACAPGAAPQAQPDARSAGVAEPTPAPDHLEFEQIAGNWRIVSVDGAAPLGVGEDKGGERTPRIHFTPVSYGGTSGCNFFGGLGLLEEGRYYAAPGGQTAMGCGDLTAQEDAITGIFWAAPTVSLPADGRLVLTGGRHRLELRRDPSLPPGAQPWGSVERPALAGTDWIVRSMDGQWFSPPGQKETRRLRFDAESWTGTIACATLSGGWSRQRDRIVAAGEISTTEQLCPPEEAAIDAKLAKLMAASPRFVTGPNGEILIAGGGHWLVGDRVR